MHLGHMQLITIFQIFQYFPFVNHICDLLGLNLLFFHIKILKCNCVQLDEGPIVQGVPF